MLDTRQAFRLRHNQLVDGNGKPRVSVLADVSLHGLAPVLKNPLAAIRFTQHMQSEVARLNLRDPSAFNARPAAIMELKRLGYYGVDVPSGMFAKLKFYAEFFKSME